MLDTFPPATVLIFALLSAVEFGRRTFSLRFPMGPYVFYLWLFFLIFTVAHYTSFEMAIWILALICFFALREYFSLVDIRLQDRWSIWGAYLSIPISIYFIQIDWYGMYIIWIPVYTFLVTSFLSTVGGQERDGTVFSIGVINFGLFLFVYCMGHLGYLAHLSTDMAAFFILSVAICDFSAYQFGQRRAFTWKKLIMAVPFTAGFALLLSKWSGIPWPHSLVIGVLVPFLVGMGRRTVAFIEADLHIQSDQLLPGKGEIIDNMKSYLFAAPVIFHYVRYFLT